MDQNIKLRELINKPTIKPSTLFEHYEDKVICHVCNRQCKIPEGEWGYCGTRFNFNGTLYTATYGDLSAIESRPIEIKPFFHYWPGSSSLTFSTWSCNFDCPWCQNHHLSRAKPDPRTASYINPKSLVGMAIRNGDQGLCVSFNEPTMLFEYCLDVFPLAKSKGLYCCFVSNGFMSPEALEMLVKAGLDGLKVDVKGDEEVYEKYIGVKGVDLVWKNVEKAIKMGLHVEIVFLLVNGVNDDENCISSVIENHLKHAGPEVPIHFTRYYPAYKFRNPPTLLEVIDRAYNMAKKAGVMYPYVGNVPGHPGYHTYCPKCGKPVIKRFQYGVYEVKLTEDKRCMYCKNPIPITGSVQITKKGFKLFV
ncbi:MAG: AmmeMemoRadiSam system radical SAM enzyme [Candidatus Nezhaarchaeales archaeon]